jgi:hypothetical protein
VVAIGKNAGTLFDTIEVLDISPESKTCNNLPNFPEAMFAAVGGVHNHTKPMICGGLDANENGVSDCFALKNNLWFEVKTFFKRLLHLICKKTIFL